MVHNHILNSVDFKPRRSWYSALLMGFLMLLAFDSNSARALVVAVTDTTVNPASYAGWTQGDPGWANVTNAGANYVYLGNGWILSAWHVGVSNAVFDSGTYTPIAGQDYTVHNPPPSMVNGLSLSTLTDLRLIRINGDPGLPSLTIASQSPPSTGANGSQVMFIGKGPTRLSATTNWQVDSSNVWTEVASGGNFHGYKTNGGNTKSWGTNALASPSSATYQQVFKNVLSTTTGVQSITEPNNSQDVRDLISMLSSYDQPGQNGALLYEAQAVSGDSGSSVFYINGNQWQLAGIINATLIYSGQSVAYGVYGDATTFADLSYYNKAYQGSICDIMKSCGNYSAVGDVNLDGVISGDGTGSPQTDDVSAFLAGWNFNNNAGAGDYVSWTHGDLNQDGKTDVNDFFVLRNALNGHLSASALTALFGSGPVPSAGGSKAVPEPYMIDLALAAVIILVGGTRPRRLRFAESLVG